LEVIDMNDTLISQINMAYYQLKQNQQLWKDELEERAVWEITLLDDLDDHQYKEEYHK